MTPSLFLQALEGKNSRVPVWFMRQAGRYLPQYRAIRAKHSLDEMFRTPELAAQITVQPIPYLNVDAAILFADILTLPSGMGFQISFGKEGPVIKNPIRTAGDIKRIHDFENLSHVAETIKLTQNSLPQDVPVIGFAGAPFTVATYLIEGETSGNFPKVLQLLYSQPKIFHQLMQKITRNTIAYLNLQKKAGVKAFQLFDTWGGILRREDYADFVLPYVQKIFKSVDLASIYYLKNSQHLLDLMEKSGADFLSLCHAVSLADDPVLSKTKKGIQGNLYNGLLYADYPVLEQEVKKTLKAARKFKKYIFNLSHGVFPDVSPDKLRFIVDIVHQFSWGKS